MSKVAETQAKTANFDANKVSDAIAANLSNKTKLQAANAASGIISKDKQLSAFLTKPFKVPANIKQDNFDKYFDSSEVFSTTALRTTVMIALAKEANSEIEAKREKFINHIEDDDVLEQFEAKLVEYKNFLDKEINKQLEYIVTKFGFKK